MYKTCKIKNISGSSKTLMGKVFDADEVFQIPDLFRIAWATSDDVLVAITEDQFQIGDGENWIESYNDQITWLKDY